MESSNNNYDNQDGIVTSATTTTTTTSTTSGNTNNNNITTTTTRLKVAGIVFGSFVGLTVGLTAPFVISKSILPYMATPGKKIYKALKFLSTYNNNDKTNKMNNNKTRRLLTNNQACTTTITKNKNNKKEVVFVDLGSGDGEAVYQATQLGYRSIGIELNFTLWLFSIMRRRFFFTKEQRSNSCFLWKNFNNYNLSDANIVMIFGVNPLMVSFSKKIARECQPGTFVLSYRFAIPLTTIPTTTTIHDDVQQPPAQNRHHDNDENCWNENNNNINTTNPTTGSISSSSNAVASSSSSSSSSFSNLLDAEIIYDVNEMRIYKCK